jgi:hypothetical protein
MSVLETIKKKLQESLDEEKLAILEAVEVELTEEEMEGLSEEEIAALIEAKKKEMKEEDDDDEEDDDEDDDEEIDVKESLAKIFEGAKIDEKVKSDLETLFNAVVAEKVIRKCDELSDKYESELEEALEKIEESIDKYISYVADEWMNENELAVEKGIRQEISENVLAGIRNLFVENYIEVPEEKIDLVAEAEDTIEELTAKLDETTNTILSLKKEIDEMKTEKIVNELATELTETEKEKLSDLISEFKYEDDSSYKEKVSLVIEKYFGKPEGKEKIDESKIDDRMKLYINHFKKK